MATYNSLNKSELEKVYSIEKENFDKCKALGLKLNMARGKPM